VAGAGGVSQAGGATKRLFESNGSAWDGINFGAVAGSGTFAKCGAGYPKRGTNFSGGGSGRFFRSELLFEVVPKTDRSSTVQMAQITNQKSYMIYK
jgi:hypothetical protein